MKRVSCCSAHLDLQLALSINGIHPSGPALVSISPKKRLLQVLYHTESASSTVYPEPLRMPLCPAFRVKSQLPLLSPVAPASLHICQDAPSRSQTSVFLQSTPAGSDPLSSPSAALPCSASAGSPALCPPCPSPDVREERVDVPGEHGDYVGDDEGGGRPGHQEEGDEGHPPQEAQHRAAGSARRSAGPGAGLLLAAAGGGGRHVPARRAAATARTATGGRTGAPRRRGQGPGPGGRGSAGSAGGRARRGGGPG